MMQKCRKKSCNNSTKNEFCEDHELRLCQAHGCSWKVTKQLLCKKHTCVILGCMGIKVVCSQYCTEHKCYSIRCSNKTIHSILCKECKTTYSSCIYYRLHTCILCNEYFTTKCSMPQEFEKFFIGMMCRDVTNIVYEMTFFQGTCAKH